MTPEASGGNGFLHRAHPFTPLTLAAVLSVLAFALPLPAGPVVLLAATIVLAVAAGLFRILIPAGVAALPFWFFSFLIHGVVRHEPLLALGLAARFSAVLVSFLTALAAVRPARLVDALLERGVPFSISYLLAATLQTVPRLRHRAAEILEAQRCRGLKVRGSLMNRARAIVPLAIPLILGALSEVDERAIALESRGAAHVVRRTPLHPPPDSRRERFLRLAMVVGAVTAVAIRILA